MLVLVLLCAMFTAAGAAVRDLRVELRGLRLPPGAQSATIAGVLTPPPAVATPITATLTLGGTRVTLDGRALRSGKLTARVRRVDLVGLGASIASGRLRVAGDAIDEEVVVAAGACTLAPRGTKRTCACRTCSTPPASIDVPDGTYAMVGPGISGAALAHLSTPDVGVRQLRLLASVFDQASLDVSPTFGLDGVAIRGGDTFVAVLGAATGERVAGGARIVGAVESSGASVSSVAWPFTLTRPDDGTPPALGGRWRLDLFRDPGQHIGAIPLSLDVAADGVTVPRSSPLDGASATGDLYEVSGGDCLVAAEGQLFCQLLARTPIAASFVRLEGALDPGNATGQGDFSIGVPPHVTMQGRWTALRP